MAFIKRMLATCFRPAAARRKRSPQEAYEAEKRRWVADQMGRILEARMRPYGDRGLVDVSRYGCINLELALSYEFDRRWWFGQTARLLSEAETASKSEGRSHKIHPTISTEESSPAKKP
ncbi:hypothetical protein GUJ93_ZPchr0011g27824 [Zizania palustris]|uniref:Uncharacterized protein n=1 Tax=Zizania palustris TaxID=103762 RepID=A0A8J5WKW4_ZIZPA|nr:hypothetical protein GUJ93_ZPchr0011g27824 [Zizania palustris]